ncbi:hypothetical protein C7S18_10295 [Ahniella affigens]|uniref:PhoD-like phosphatase metallophosphatase domain-containing protein n=1 Tax=Ahniella affigens TaxID=2021234 RepID=A0A2P1PRV2_9GAMM|nr:alkaline phosphatase D family protein [Ahniella affigens]AVP97560.1 hypothetical protein C7S18_10295 [Ahniella affigens]
MTRLLFASCMNNRHDSKGKVWTQAIAFRPDWLFLIGDNIYLDWGDAFGRAKDWSAEQLAEELNSRYAEQFRVKSFRDLLKSIPAGQVVGTWDDHDFAFNDAFGASAGHDMPQKRRVARAFFHHYFRQINQRPLPTNWTQLRFADAINSPDANLDLYRAFDLGPLRIIITDGRYYRENRQEVRRSPQLLGVDQEAWLVEELQSTALHPLIVSGSTMTNSNDQAWDYHDEFFVRLKPSLANRRALFIGGDVHENRLIQHNELGVVEIVSSGAGLGLINDFAYKRNFAVLDLSDSSVAISLIRKSRVQYSATFDLGTRKLTGWFDVDNATEDHRPTARRISSSLTQARRKEGKLPRPPGKKK